MTPLHLSHALLHTPELLDILADAALHPLASSNRYPNPSDLQNQLLNKVLDVWKYRWAGEALHQVGGARELFEQNLQEFCPGKPLIFGALGSLARDFFVFHKGELMWEPSAHLRW